MANYDAKTEDNKCIFCEIVKGNIPAYKVWENKNFLFFLDIKPINPGHILLVPREHFEEVFDLSSDLYDEAFQIVKKISKSFKEVTFAKKTGVVIEGFGVPHCHIHIVPIYHGNELNPERAKNATEEELKEMQLKLKECFKNI